MTKKYKNVLDLINDTSDDADVKTSVKRKIKSHSVARTLFAMRVKAGLTQQQLQKKTGLTQSKISKIEKLSNTEFKTGDLAQYCNGLGLNVELAFVPQGVGLVEKVKNHFVRMLEALDSLEQMAKGDKEIEKGIGEFFDEASVNLNMALLELLEKANKLKPANTKKKGLIQVTPPISSKDFKRLISGSKRGEKALSKT